MLHCGDNAFCVTLISRRSQCSTHEGASELQDVESVTWGRGIKGEEEYIEHSVHIIKIETKGLKG